MKRRFGIHRKSRDVFSGDGNANKEKSIVFNAVCKSLSTW